MTGVAPRGVALEWIGAGLRSCLNCGSWSPEASGLCRECFKLLPESNPGSVLIAKKLKVRFLFRWDPGASDALSRLIRGLKGGGRRRAWHHWAKRMASTRMNLEGESTIFVPCPRARRRRDHAYFWTEGLSQFGGGRFADGTLKLEAGEFQKDLSFHERWKTRRVVNMTGWRPPTRARIIVGDDVLTTGSTAVRIYEALGKPAHFEVWTLAYRSRERLRPLGSL